MVLLPSTCAASGIYSYRDEKGTWHFTNVPSDSRYSANYKRGVSYEKSGRPQKEKNRKQLKCMRLTERELDPIVQGYAEEYNLDPELIKAVISIESAGNVHARSSKGAVGLMQLLPGTAREMGVNDLLDPHENIKGGSRYLKTMLETFNGDMLKALAAYNAGPQAVERYKGIPPYPETVRYVEKVLMEWYQNLKYKSAR